MSERDEEIQNLERLMSKARYSPQIYGLVLAAVEEAIESSGIRRHISGRELLDSLVTLIVRKHGLLGGFLLKRWGVFSSEDIGEVVFDLVDAKLLKKRDEDSKKDFEGYDVFGEIERRALMPPVLDFSRL
ncbi:MAG: hypothetical protein N2234_08240 [Planctomycetota bacterium]|nr:hypothetical protein [Planctomycetota bacterium]